MMESDAEENAAKVTFAQIVYYFGWLVVYCVNNFLWSIEYQTLRKCLNLM